MVDNTQTQTDKNGGGRWMSLSVSTLVVILAVALVVVMKGFLGAAGGAGPTASKADTGEVGKGGVDWSRFEEGGKAGVMGAGQQGDAAEVERAIADSETLRAQGAFEQAEKVLAEAVAKYPFDTSLRLTQAQAYIGQQKWKEAYEAYQSAIAIKQTTRGTKGPGESASQAAVTKEEAALHFQAGTIAYKAGGAAMMARALEHYTMAQAGEPGEPKYPLYLAMVQLKLGQETPAMASLIRATRLNPDLAEAWGTLAEMELNKNHLGLAAQHLEKARKLQPEVARWRIVEARILNRQGEAERAATLLLTLDPATKQTSGVLALLAESYGLMGKRGEAAAAYIEAAKAKPEDAELAYQAAVWCEKAGQVEDAKRFARAADAMGHEGAKGLLAGIEGGK